MLRNMRHLTQILGALTAFACLAACGGSKQSTTSSVTSSGASTPSTASTSSSTGTATTPTSTGATSPVGTPSSTSTPSPTKTSTTANSGGVGVQPTTSTGSSGGESPGTKVKKPAGGSSNARVPATFTIRPDGSVSPQSVSAPAFLAVSLTVVSRDGRRHQIVVHTPKSRSLTVSANAPASVLIGGLRAGSYGVDVDGTPRAKLVIGGEPGP
jgi:hypothetical protein